MNGPAAKQGFGLIEVMISASILAVGMSGILTLYSSLMDNYVHQRLLAQSLHIAEATMENLLVRYADDTALSAGAHTGPAYSVGGQPGGTFFATSWIATDAVPFAGAREIVITVTWSERGTTKTFKLKTVRT
jgi:prepilin-type N-terminal cleavage/methylation domain-containing protein